MKLLKIVRVVLVAVIILGFTVGSTGAAVAITASDNAAVAQYGDKDRPPKLGPPENPPAASDELPTTGYTVITLLLAGGGLMLGGGLLLYQLRRLT